MRKPSTANLLPLILLFALAGMALVTFATTAGPGVGGDATIYLTTARRLLAGHGLTWPEADGSTRLLPYTPPFYPLILSVVGLLTPDLVSGARWLNILMFGATILLCGWYFYKAGGSPWLAVVVSGLVAASPVLIGVQVWAMSESLFLLCGFAGLFLLLDYLKCPRPVVLAGAALLAGAAFLARYIGVAFVMTGGLALLLIERGPAARVSIRLRWDRLHPALLYGLLAILPTLVWLIIDYFITGTVGSRSGQPADAYWRRFLEMGPALQNIILFWLLPESKAALLPRVLQSAVWIMPLIVLIILGLLIGRKLIHPDSFSQPVGSTTVTGTARLALVLALFCVVYLLVLALVQVFTYPPVTLASRMLSPVHLAVLILLGALLHLTTQVLFGGAPRIALAGGLLLAAVMGTYLLRGAQVANGYHRTGIGYNAPEWQESGTLAALRKLPPDVPLVTNETTAIMYFLGRPSYTLHEIFQDHPSQTFSVYGSGDDDSQRAFREQGGALVLFYNTLHSDFAMYGDRTDERIAALRRGLYVYYEGEDGVILFDKPPSFATH